MNNHLAKIKLIYDLLNEKDMLQISFMDEKLFGISLPTIKKCIEQEKYGKALIGITAIRELSAGIHKNDQHKKALCEELLITMETHLFHLNVDALTQSQSLLVDMIKDSFGQEQHNTSIDFSTAVNKARFDIEPMKTLQNNIKLEKSRGTFKNFALISHLMSVYVDNHQSLSYSNYILSGRKDT